MANIAVAALNGFLGDRAGLDVSDVVNPRARKARVDYYLRRPGRPARGGAGPIAKRCFYKWCSAAIDDGCTILFVGKSYGGHWVLDAIRDLYLGPYSHALVFDPTSVLHRRESHTRKVPCPDNITVVRQLGLRSGYKVAGAKDVVIEARHSNIERTKAGQCILDEWLNRWDL